MSMVPEKLWRDPTAESIAKLAGAEKGAGVYSGCSEMRFGKRTTG